MDKLELADKIYGYIYTHDLAHGDYVTSNGAACLLGAGRLIQCGPREEWKPQPIFSADYYTTVALGFDSREELIVFNDSSSKGEVLEHIGRMANRWLEEKIRAEEVSVVDA